MKVSELIEDIIEDTRNLRDADFHVCPDEKWGDIGECTCEHFDRVIDKLEELKKSLSNLNEDRKF